MEGNFDDIPVASRPPARQLAAVTQAGFLKQLAHVPLDAIDAHPDQRTDLGVCLSLDDRFEDRLLARVRRPAAPLPPIPFLYCHKAIITGPKPVSLPTEDRRQKAEE